VQTHKNTVKELDFLCSGKRFSGRNAMERNGGKEAEGRHHQCKARIGFTCTPQEDKNIPFLSIGGTQHSQLMYQMKRVHKG
jgi:hypothetical protein